MIEKGQFGVDSTFQRSFKVKRFVNRDLWVRWSAPFWSNILESSEIPEVMRWSHCGKVLLYLRS